VLPCGQVTEETEHPVHANMLPRTYPQTAGNLLTLHHSTQKFILTISTSVDHETFFFVGRGICHIDEIKHELHWWCKQPALTFRINKHMYHRDKCLNLSDNYSELFQMSMLENY